MLFFRTNIVLAAFFLHMYVKKAAKMTFVQKKHAKNVDEIDGRRKIKEIESRVSKRDIVQTNLRIIGVT